MSIDTLFLSLIIFLLLVILLLEHARTAGTPRAPTLEGALDALVGSGVLPGGVAEILRYMALRRRRDRYPAWIIALHTVIQCSAGTFTSSLRSAVTRRWEKTDMKSLMESLLDLFPTPQAVTWRLRRERPEDIRRATRELFRRQWSRAGNMKGKLDLIIDRTQKQVWPKTRKGRRRETMRWAVEKGREKHLCLSTIMVTNGDTNLFLGVEPVTPLRNSPLDEVKRWIRYAVRLGIKIRYLLIDRGFEGRETREYLAAQRRAGRIGGFVQPAVKNTTVKRHIVRCVLSGRSTLVVPLDGYHLVVERVESVSQSDLEKLRALPPDILRWMLGGMRGEGKRLKNLREYGETADEARERLRRYQPALRRVVDAHHAWYTTSGPWEEGLHRELYRGRWRIENGFRDSGHFEGKSKSSSLRVRLHLAAVTLALYNAWQLERTRDNRLRAEDAAQRLSHTLEHAALILLRDALATLTQALQNLTGATGTTVSAELLRTVSESNPLHAQVLQVVLTREKPPPQAGKPPPTKEREVMAPAG